MRGLIAKIALLALVAFLVGVGGLIFLAVRSHSMPVEQTVIHEEKTIEATKLTHLDVETDTADIQVTQSQDNLIHVQLKGEAYGTYKQLSNDARLRVEETGNNGVNIVVTESDFFPISFMTIRDLRLEVAIPAKQYDQLRLASSTGNVGIEPTVTAANMSLHTSTGDIALGGFTGVELKVGTDTGNMELQQVASDEVTVNSSTGDLEELELLRLTKELKAESSTGDIAVRMAKLPESLNLTMRSDTGDMEAELPGLSFGEKDEHKITATRGTGGPKIEMESSTGNLKISE